MLQNISILLYLNDFKLSVHLRTLKKITVSSKILTFFNIEYNENYFLSFKSAY